MFSDFKGKILSILLICFLIFLWIFINSPDKSNQNLTQKNNVYLSGLSPELKQSLNNIEQRAKNMYGNTKTSFSLNFFNKLGEKEIDSSIPLIVTTRYASGKVEEKITKMPSSFIGLTPDELTSILGEWTIKDYVPGYALILWREIDDLSVEEKQYKHIGIKDGKVAIFYGKRGNHLQKITEIDVDKLADQERLALQEGIVVSSKEELVSILDSLVSTYIND